MIIKITIAIKRRINDDEIIDGSFVIIAWIFWIDRYRGDNVKIDGKLSSKGINNPELKRININRNKLIIILINCVLNDKPIRKPIFEIKIIIGMIYIIANNISSANKFALLNESVISNENNSWITPKDEDQIIIADRCSLFELGVQSIVLEKLDESLYLFAILIDTTKVIILDVLIQFPTEDQFK